MALSTVGKVAAVVVACAALLVAVKPKPVDWAGLPAQCTNAAAPPEFAAAPAVAPEARAFDVVVWGATGFTGQLVAKYLDSHYGPESGFKWAIAGRSQGKLDAVRAELASSPPVIVADSADRASLEHMVGQCRTVLTTVGPYTWYGSLLVEVVAQAGVNYVDLSGETYWQRDMLDSFDATARGTGAKIVVAGGYDSVPFDLGVLAARTHLRAQHGAAASEVTAVVLEMRGSASGGTLASAWESIEAVQQGRVSSALALDPYALNPNEPCRVDTDISGWGLVPRFDRDAGVLGFMHLMSPVNARIVRRSLALAGQHACAYAEGMSVGALWDATLFVTRLVLQGKFPLKALIPERGEGPPPAALEQGSVRLKVVAKGPDAQGTTRVSAVELIAAGDPGYNATSKWLAETALCLSRDECHSQGIGPAGGVLTSASACGKGLLDRLEQADGGRFFSVNPL